MDDPAVVAGLVGGPVGFFFEEQQARVDVGLRIRCTAEMLLRLATDTAFAVEPTDQFSYLGDLELLTVLAEGLETPKDLLSLRALRNCRRLPQLHCTSAPTVYAPAVREDVPIPPLKP